MIVFREKRFGAITDAAKKGLANPMSWLALGVSGVSAATARSNYKMQKQRISQADVQHKELIEQNKKLIKALSGVEKGLATHNIPKQTTTSKSTGETGKPWISIRGRKIFSEKKEKTYGKVLSDAVRGASLGLMAGTGALQLSGVNKTGSVRAKAMIPLMGAALGAVAGSLWGIVKTADQVISQHGTGHKLIEEVLKNLKRAGYKRDTDWTTDPKRATTMKTKVCVVISRSADELGVLINMANDPKLKSVSTEITKNLPVDAQETEKFSDRFNDLQISSYPSSKDAVFVFSIIESFIKRGFPVYLLEVG
jgi:hypothetical protein